MLHIYPAQCMYTQPDIHSMIIMQNKCSRSLPARVQARLQPEEQKKGKGYSTTKSGSKAHTHMPDIEKKKQRPQRPTDPCERLSSPLAAPPLSALEVSMSSSSASRCLWGVDTMDNDADDSRGRMCFSVAGDISTPSRAMSRPACAGSDAAILRSLPRRYHCCAGVDLSTVWADMEGRGVLRRVIPGTGRTCNLSRGTSTWPVLTL